MNKIETVNLNKEYPTFQLKDVSFEVPKGYVTGFIGKNGAGKTTTIKAILSMIDYRGAILIDGKNTKETNFHQEVGVVMDDSFLAKDWTIKNVNQAMEIGYENWNEDTFFQYLRNFDIDCGLKVKELSRGMKIKLMLAIALSHSANLLILDEPTSGLDPSMRDEFKNYFMILKGGVRDSDKIDERAILGKKVGTHNCELLIERDALLSIPLGFTEDIVTIDRIMVLFGRVA